MVMYREQYTLKKKFPGFDKLKKSLVDITGLSIDVEKLGTKKACISCSKFKEDVEIEFTSSNSVDVFVPLTKHTYFSWAVIRALKNVCKMEEVSVPKIYDQKFSDISFLDKCKMKLVSVDKAKKTR